MDSDKGTLSAWLCPQSENPLWDDFLSKTQYSHFYQSSMWAQVRILNGWHPLITIITQNNRLIGGFQMLWCSKSYIGKIGIVLKGPVTEWADPSTKAFILKTLKMVTKKNNIRALIIQPPNKDLNMTKTLEKSCFLKNHINFLIRNNTVIVDLQGSEEEILKRMKRQKRQNIKKALENNGIIREGDKSDLKIFFKYMIETCNRQQVAPSPSTLDFLSRMWDIFSPKGHMKLFLIKFNDTDVSAIIILPFGNTVYLWKFGWSGDYGPCRPNERLYWEIFKWAKNQGYKYADLDAIAPGSENRSVQYTSKSYSRFKREFGGEIVYLSNGFIYIPNPIIKGAFSLLEPLFNSVPYLKKTFLSTNSY